MTKLQKQIGFTLVELLVVVLIIAVLVALALPGFLEFQTRAKVAKTKTHLRIVANALEAYHVDFGNYPIGKPTAGVDPFGVFSTMALQSLTTPITYCSQDALRDSFGALRPISPQFALGSLAPVNAARRGPDRPFSRIPDESSLLYFYYKQFSVLRQNQTMDVEGFAIISAGPDRQDSFSVYFPFPTELPQAAGSFGVFNVIDSIYDPTNGTTSRGDIPRWGGSIVAPPR